MKVTFPALPPAAEDVADVIARRIKHSAAAERRRKAEKWIPITVPEFRPFGLIVFGDPHLDDDHCDWPTLTRHIDIAKRPGIYGACVGDYRNNWVGRLIRIYADQQVSHPEGQSLAKWFLGDCGVRWAFNLLGNHDMWNEGEAITGLIAPGAVYLAAWEAKVDLRCRGDSWRIHAAHDFKGNSEMNKVHGPLKAAVRSGCEAEVYICGHKHNYASHHFEHEATNRVGLVVRARGYKRQDRHALVNGYPDGAYGHSTMIVVRPGEASPMRRVMHFPDVDAGADYLAFLRGDKVPSLEAAAAVAWERRWRRSGSAYAWQTAKGFAIEYRAAGEKLDGAKLVYVAPGWRKRKDRKAITKALKKVPHVVRL